MFACKFWWLRRDSQFSRRRMRRPLAVGIALGIYKTFENLVVRVPESVDPVCYNTAALWCETFSMLTVAAKYC